MTTKSPPRSPPRSPSRGQRTVNQKKSNSILDRFETCDRTGSHDLDISCLALSEWPTETAIFPNIQILNAYSNKFVMLPSFETFRRLEVLNLSRNALVNLESLNISRLTALKNINLSRNNLSRLPDDIVKLPLLETLDVQRNKLDSLPAKINELRSLHHFDVSWNNLRFVSDSLEDVQALKTLNLSNNPIDIESLPPRIKRFYEQRVLFISKNERRILIQRALGVRRTIVNREKEEILQSLSSSI